ILAFDSCFPDSVVGFKPNDSMTTEYVQGWLSFLQPIIEERAPQVAQKNINLRILKELDISVPPMCQQKRYSNFCKSLSHASNNQKESLLALDDLFNSLLQRAFKGDL
ncbi:MAG: restriction endonuclease subunit S, partial [Phormidesmis sp.]